MLEKILEIQGKNPDHLVFNNFIETQTILNLLAAKDIITPEEFEKEKIKIVKSMIVDGISKGLFSEKTSELFKMQLERLNREEVGA